MLILLDWYCCNSELILANLPCCEKGSCLLHALKTQLCFACKNNSSHTSDVRLMSVKLWDMCELQLLSTLSILREMRCLNKFDLMATTVVAAACIT